MLVAFGSAGRLVLGITAAALLWGCGGATSDDPTAAPLAHDTTVPGTGSPSATSAGRGARIAALEQARGDVAPVVTALVSASQQVAGLARQWRDNRQAIDLGAQMDPVRTQVADAVAVADGALDASTSVDVAAADAALDTLVQRLTDQLALLEGVAADEVLARSVDDLGVEFTEQINARGSRTPQREAMQDLVERFDTIEADLRAGLQDSACPGPLRARLDGVKHMRDVAEELADLATTGQGDAFDEVRAAATKDPFDQGTTNLETVAPITGCADVAAVIAVRDDLGALVDDIEAALNPADLVQG